MFGSVTLTQCGVLTALIKGVFRYGNLIYEKDMKYFSDSNKRHKYVYEPRIVSILYFLLDNNGIYKRKIYIIEFNYFYCNLKHVY